MPPAWGVRYKAIDRALSQHINLALEHIPDLYDEIRQSEGSM
jgi:hypothetical protein